MQIISKNQIKPIILFALLFLFLSGSILHAAESEIRMTEAGKTVGNLKHRWQFFEVQPGVQALYAQVVVPLPVGQEVEQVSGDSSLWKKEWNKPGRLLVGLGALNSKIQVTLKGGGQRSLEFKTSLNQSIIREKDCNAAGLKFIESKKNPLRSFMGLVCEQKADMILVHLSGPLEFETDTSTIFESAGKGERWKTYEISRSNLKSTKNEIARFTFQAQGKKLQFALLLDIKSAAATNAVPEEPKKFFRTAGGIALGTLAASGAAGTESKMTLGLHLDSITQPYLWKMVGFGKFTYAAPVSKASSLEFEFGTGPSFALGSSGRSLFGLIFSYVALGQDQDVAGKALSLRHNQMGLNILTAFAMGDKGSLQFRIRSSGFGSATTDLSIGLGYEHAKNVNNFWRLGLIFQNQKAKTTTSEFKFGQTYINYLFSL